MDSFRDKYIVYIVPVCVSGSNIQAVRAAVGCSLKRKDPE